MFAIERFSQAEYLRAHTFQLPAELDMHRFLHGAFGPHLPDESGPHHVVVEFSREKALLVAARTWHPTQQIEHLVGGRIRLSFDVPHLAQVVSWIHEWGPHVRAIAPDALVNEVVRELDATRAQY